MRDKECPIPQPFRAHLWSIIFISGLFFLTFISRFILAPLMPSIEKDLNITHSQAGSLFLMISLGFFVAQVCSGFLSSRVKHKGSLVISILGVGLALLIFNLSSSLLVIRGILFLLGMAAGLHMPSAMATITAMVNRQEWGKALAVQQTAPPLSLVVGPLLAMLFLGWFSWRAILTILGGAAIAAALAFMRYGRCGDFPGDSPRPGLVKILIFQRSFWIMVVLFALAMGGSVGIYTCLLYTSPSPRD